MSGPWEESSLKTNKQTYVRLYGVEFYWRLPTLAKNLRSSDSKILAILQILFCSKFHSFFLFQKL